MSRECVLKVVGLSASYSSNRGTIRAVDNVSFDLMRGEVLGIVGESGCGKTALSLSLINCLPRGGQVRAGRVLFEDRDLLSLKGRDLRKVRGSRIGYIPQEPMSSLNPVLTIGHQLSEIGVSKLGLTRRAAVAHSVGLLDKVGIANARRRLDSYPSELSGGMRQRVLIALAIACDPVLLIADEPTTALDVSIQAQILDLIKQLRAEAAEPISVILITHDLGVAGEMCDRVMVMYAGCAVEVATADELFGSPEMPYSRGLIDALPADWAQGSGQRPTRLRAIEGYPPSLNREFQRCRFSERCTERRDICMDREPDLSPRGGSVTHVARCWGTEHDGWISANSS